MTQLEIISWNHSGECSLYVWDYFEIFPQKTYHHFGHVTSSWHPKTVLFGHQRNFFQIFAFLTTLTWKLSHKTIMEIVHSMWEIILKDWIEIFSLYWTYDVILTPKTALLGIFSKFFFQISAFFTLKRKSYHEIMVEIVHSILKIILNQFYQ